MSTTNKTVPRGIRNNNPLNIRLTATRWVGMRAIQEDKGFCQFVSMAYGWRAAFMLLFFYYYKHGLKTVRDIISRWAPPSDGNNTEAYIASVAADMCWPEAKMLITDKSELGDPREKPLHWFMLALSMFKIEQGDIGLNFDDLLRGLILASQDFNFPA